MSWIRNDVDGILNPCCACRAHAGWKPNSERDKWAAMCTGCRAHTPFFTTKFEAAVEWNKTQRSKATAKAPEPPRSPFGPTVTDEDSRAALSFGNFLHPMHILSDYSIRQLAIEFANHREKTRNTTCAAQSESPAPLAHCVDCANWSGQRHSEYARCKLQPPTAPRTSRLHACPRWAKKDAKTDTKSEAPK